MPENMSGRVRNYGNIFVIYIYGCKCQKLCQDIDEHLCFTVGISQT